MAELQAEEKKADEIQMAQIEPAKEQAKIAAEKELALKELKLNTQQAQASTGATVDPPLHNRPSPRSYQPL